MSIFSFFIILLIFKMLIKKTIHDNNIILCIFIFSLVILRHNIFLNILNIFYPRFIVGLMHILRVDQAKDIYIKLPYCVDEFCGWLFVLCCFFINVYRYTCTNKRPIHNLKTQLDVILKTYFMMCNGVA